MSCFPWLVCLRQRRRFKKRLLRLPPSLFPHRPSALLLLVAPPLPAHLLRMRLNAAWDAVLACSRGLVAAVVWYFSRRTQPASVCVGSGKPNHRPRITVDATMFPLSPPPALTVLVRRVLRGDPRGARPLRFSTGSYLAYPRSLLHHHRPPASRPPHIATTAPPWPSRPAPVIRRRLGRRGGLGAYSGAGAFR